MKHQLPMSFDEEMDSAFDFQISLLEEAHKRARGPKARRRIEAKIAEAKSEMEKIRRAAEVVDLEYGRWLRAFNEMLREEKHRPAPRRKA
jgi:hypothetical protein